MKIKPILDNILIQPIEPEDQTDSGLYIPENSKEKTQRGTVIQVGIGKFENGNLQKPCVRKGDLILFKQWCGEDVIIENVVYKFIKEEDILAILEN